MKTLLILRHAKSSWNDENVLDHDRPLNKRGKRDAPRIGKLLYQSQLSPDLIISSTAKRARKTASKVAKIGRIPLGRGQALRCLLGSDLPERFQGWLPSRELQPATI